MEEPGSEQHDLRRRSRNVKWLEQHTSGVKSCNWAAPPPNNPTSNLIMQSTLQQLARACPSLLLNDPTMSQSSLLIKGIRCQGTNFVYFGNECSTALVCPLLPTTLFTISSSNDDRTTSDRKRRRFSKYLRLFSAKLLLLAP